MNKWIPVDEKLPEKSGDYLVTTRNGYVQIAKWGYDLYKKSGWSGKNMANCIMAWMPLPKPYTAESEDKEMTKQEILEYFKDINHAYNESTRLDDLSHMLDELMQGNSDEDCISRKVVLDKIKEVCFSKEQQWVDFRVSQGSNGQRDLIISFIEDLPSVQPKPKTDVLDNIRAEIIDTGAYEQEVNGKTEFLKGINYCLGVIDKYTTEKE